MVINCYHSTGGQQHLWKESVLHTHSPGNRDNTKPAWTPAQRSPAHRGQDELRPEGLSVPRVALFWWWLKHINTPTWKRSASVPSPCFFWSYIEDTSIHSFNQSVTPSLIHSTLECLLHAEHWVYTLEKFFKIWIRNKQCHEGAYNPVGAVRHNHK